MSAASYVGDTLFREIVRNESTNLGGLDTMLIVLRGARSLLSSQANNYTKGSSPSGHSNMFLQNKQTRDSGNFATIELNYAGFLGETDPESGLVDVDDDISLQSVTLGTDTGENVSFFYYTQTSSYRWIYRGSSAPRSPRFPMTLDTSIGVNNLFEPNPPDYSGSVNLKKVGRMQGFKRKRLSSNVWAVFESWIQKVEPNVTVS